MIRTYHALNRIIGALLISIFGLLVLDVIWQVASRYLIGQSNSFTEEFARFALIWLAILGTAYLNGQRGHLAIDFLLRKLPPNQMRQRIRIIEIIMLVFALVVMVIGGINLVYISFTLGQTSSAMGVSLGFVYLIVPISGALIVFYSIFHLLYPEEVSS